MNKTLHYQIITGNRLEVEAAVSIALNDGWTLVGGAVPTGRFMTNDGRPRASQDIDALPEFAQAISLINQTDP